MFAAKEEDMNRRLAASEDAWRAERDAGAKRVAGTEDALTVSRREAAAQCAAQAVAAEEALLFTKTQAANRLAAVESELHHNHVSTEEVLAHKNNEITTLK